MKESLLSKMRRLNKILQKTGDVPVEFIELCELLNDVLEANIYIVTKKGKILGTSYVDIEASPVINKDFFPDSYIKAMNSIVDTRYNISNNELRELFVDEINTKSNFVTIVPILGSGKRLGTLLLARKEQEFSDDDLVLAEYSASVVGMEIIRSDRLVVEVNARKKAIVQIAIETLSYSELDAMIHIFKELGGDSGLLVASKIADRVGITRSVIVNALRKLESASVIESRSLGMKGTHIRILNEYLSSELFKQNKIL